jgi:predicted extracellular nuclease
MARSILFSSLVVSLLSLTFAQSIAEINGNRFVSPYRNQNVTGVTGLVTAIGPDGLWLRSTTPDDDPTTSESIYVFRSGGVAGPAVGDIITINGRITEYRSSAAYLLLTEIASPVIVETVSSDNEVTALVIAEDNNYPPTEQYTSLDGGDIFAVPNNQSLISIINPELDPSEYGLDFWESLLGELVTVKSPIAVSRPNQFGDVWVRGSAWPTTNLNERGGLTMTDADANPETIIIGTPLDGTDNGLDSALGDVLADITGVVYYAFGFYRILPTTAVSVIEPNTGSAGPSTLVSSDTCEAVTIGSYNVENLNPESDNLPAIADHIVNYMNSPPLLFLQEIEDDNGETEGDVVSANVTLQTLADNIASLGGPAYSFIDVVPVADQDGGVPGGNIRVAYMYNADVIELVDPNPGSSTDAVVVVETDNGLRLNFNPGRIEPNDAAWDASRKPLVAQWRFVDADTASSSSLNSTTSSNSTDASLSTTGAGANGQPGRPTPPTPSEGPSAGTFLTINVHLASKGGSSSLHGDPRPPVNGGVEQRQAQTGLVADFITSVLAVDADAKIVAAGDWNEFSFVAPLTEFVAESTMVEADVVAGLDELERYTYLFDMNSQQLDHVFVSQAVADAGPGNPGEPGNGGPGGPGNGGPPRPPGNGGPGGPPRPPPGHGPGRPGPGPGRPGRPPKAKRQGATTPVQVEHIHVNTWVSFDDQASDHDPTVVKMNLC